MVASSLASPVALGSLRTKKLSTGIAKDKVKSLAWSVDGRRLASGSCDKLLRVWVPEKAESRSSSELKGHTGEVSCVKWDPTHPERLASCSTRDSGSTGTDRGLYFWDIRQGKPTSVIQTRGENINMTWSPDGKTIVVGTRNDVVSWIDVAEGKVVKEEKNKKETNQFIFSHTGTALLTAIDSDVEIRSFPDSELLHSVFVCPVATTVLDLDSKGRYLAVGSNDATVTLWETEEWTCVRSLGHCEGAIRSVAFSHDGQYLASASDDPFITISEIPSAQTALTIPTGFTCNALAWHPSKTILAYACDEVERGVQTGIFRILGM